MAWFRSFKDIGQITIGFVISLVMVLFGKLIHRLVDPIPDPAAWAQFATEGHSPFPYLILGGILFGTVAGLVLMWRYARFQVKGSWLQRAGRYLLGIVGLILIYLSLDLLFSLIAEDLSLLGYILRYLRYAAIAFWATFCAPWVFLKLKLAQPAESRDH
jgi:hypothetical protein